MTSKLICGLAVFAVSACSEDNVLARPQPEQVPADVLYPSPGAFVFVDRQSGSVFNLRGEAIAGPLAQEGFTLTQLPGVNMFWFAWSVYFPGSQIWGRTDGVRAASLPTDKSGDPACTGGIDCIPSLPNIGPPAGALAWTRPGEPDAAYLRDDDLVIGTFFARKARAYSHNLLWWHEIANDEIDGMSYSVTFCPLTGSGVVFDGSVGPASFGVSGNLFNSNLVMYDHASESLWPQLWMGAVSGKRKGQWLDTLPATETTWAQWRELHPETLVLSDETGFSRDYRSYPYGDYRIDDSTTFRTTTPLPDPLYPNKAMTFGLMDRATGAAKAFVHADMASKAGSRAVINDTFNGEPVVVVYDAGSQLAIAFVARDASGASLELEAASYEPQ